MLTKNGTDDKKTQIQLISLDQLVPEDHLLRKIDKYIDFDFIYDLVEEKYSTQTGNVSTSSGTKRTRVYGCQSVQSVLFVPMCAVLRHAVET